MKVVIAGGSGQVGAVLARAMLADHHDIVILSRGPKRSICRTVGWDAENLGDWTAEIDGADVVVNLAGRSVNCRYNSANRKAILESRVNSTRVIGNAIVRAAKPPKVWLQASTATIYSHRFDAPNDEATGVTGGEEAGAPEAWRFSIEVAKAWEETCNEAEVPNTRKVLLRSAMTMSPAKDGIFDVLLGLVRHGLGGTIGDGRQYVSWIHYRDFTQAIYWLIAHESLCGPVNLASPNPLPNAEFMRILRHAAGFGFGLPTPAWMLELGARFLQTETELVLKSRRVVPGKLLKSGFEFLYPEWRAAAADLADNDYRLKTWAPQ